MAPAEGATRHRLFLACVLAGQVADEVDGMRRGLGSTDLERIAPHLTLVAPFNLADHALTAAHGLLARVAASTRPLELSLGAPNSFPPDHHVIYLSVGGDLEGLDRLRERCWSAPVPVERGANERPFVAHVTLRSHAEPHLVASAKSTLAHYQRSLVVDRLALLRFEGGVELPHWEVIDEVVLDGVVVLGRGGREVRLVHATLYSANDRALLARNASTPADDTSYGDAGTAIVLRALVDDVLVGLARLTPGPRSLDIECLIVDVAARGSGIGGQLVRYLERLAIDLGRIELRAEVPDEAVAFYLYCGYQLVGERRTSGARARVVRVLSGV